LKQKTILVGLKDGEIFCKFASAKDADEDVVGQTDYILELDEDDIKTLVEWFKE